MCIRDRAIPSAVTISAIFIGYRLLCSRFGLSPWNAVFAPFAAATFVYALLRSMVTTLRQGGVIWRGTFYSLATLRKYVPPIRLRP